MGWGSYTVVVIEMAVGAVRVELPSNSPVVLLREVEGERRTLPIFIGTPEATAIAYSLQHIDTPRPMTHDLLVALMGELGGELDRILITDLQEGTYFAELQVRTAGEVRKVSCRPSDAVAIAVRTGTKIYCDDDLLDAEGVVIEEDADAGSDEDPDELVREFRDFIDGVTPEDFEK